MIRYGLGKITLFLLLLLAYSVAYARGYRKGMFDQWMTSSLLSHVLWNGTGENSPDAAGGFDGLLKFMEEKNDNPDN